MGFYRISSAHELPSILIIDPITGAKQRQLTGFVEAHRSSHTPHTNFAGDNQLQPIPKLCHCAAHTSAQLCFTTSAPGTSRHAEADASCTLCYEFGPPHNQALLLKIEQQKCACMHDLFLPEQSTSMQRNAALECKTIWHW